MPYPFSKPVAVIAAGGSLSGVVVIGAGELVAIQVPVGWNPAAITFQASFDGITFFNLMDSAGNEVKATPVFVGTSGSHIAIGEELARSEHFRGAPYMMLRSGTAADPIAQQAQRSLTCVVRKMVVPRLGL